MATYDSLISRTDASALIPEDAQREIVQAIPEGSSVLKMFRRLPNMTRAQRRIPVMSFYPTAYFVDGDSGMKQTTEMKWENKYLNAAEIACIVPIPEAVLDDAEYDIWTEVRPQIVSEMGRVIDLAMFHGTNAPSDWPDDILTAATAAGTVVTAGTGVDLYDDILGEDGVFALVETCGYDVNGIIGATALKAKLRGLRDADGNPIFKRSIQDKTQYMIDGNDAFFPKNGGINPASALMIAGAFNEAVYSVRQDVTFKVITEGVITDAAGDIVMNLPQQDSIALRVVMRLAWQVPNPLNRIQETEASRYPFGVLIPA